MGGEPPDAAVGFVAVGVAVAGLVVTDDWIEPVADVEGTVRAGLDGERAEDIGRGSEERAEFIGAEA